MTTAMTPDDMPHTPGDLLLQRLAIRAPRVVQLRIERYAYGRRWFRWLKARTANPRRTLLPMAPQRRLPHWSPTAKGLRPCKGGCHVCSAEAKELVDA